MRHFFWTVSAMLLFFSNHGVSFVQKFRSTKSSSVYTRMLSSKSDAQNPKVKTQESVITPRNVDYSAWYNDVITASDLVDQSPVRGCMVIKPWGMGIWDLMHKELDTRIKESGTENAYFPLFIPKSFLSKEAEHVDGFAKECAVVTHHRLCKSADGKSLIPDPAAELEEPLIVRPTSETIIWNMFNKWINSHRDLPLKINQWANVVRWEMRTRPFLRTSEFLWQEGHTAHASSEEAIKTAKDSLDMYHSFCKEYLALPCIKGRKSPSERFAGAEETYTIEALMQNGWALQSGTSHFLGQNFARAFDVYYQAETGTRELVWATSWGVSTRLVGAVVMTHSDDKGLVLPPYIAPVQVVIVPISKGSGEDHEKVMAKVKEIAKLLKAQNLRVKIDDRDHIRPGAKYFEWERKGVPLRIDLGAKDLLKGTAFVTIRNEIDKKCALDLAGNVGESVRNLIDGMNDSMYQNAKKRLEGRTFRVDSYDVMKRMIESTNENEKGFYLVPWKCDAKNEAAIKEECKATIRCYPDEFNLNMNPEMKCFFSGEPATHMALFARAF